MTDDLEQQLRDGLRRGVLPGAPEALRRGLAELPAEPRRPRFSGVFGRLRWIALASAAAAALAFVIVVRSLPGPTGVGPGASLQSPNSSAVTATPSPGATAQPTTGPTGSAPPATPTPPLVRPANSPSPGPSAGAGFTCAATTVLPATTSAVVQVNDVRLGSHAGYDRIVLEFAGTGRPGLTVAVASPPFVGDASGNPIVVPGKAFLTLKLYDASDYPTYAGPGSISAGYPRLTALVNNGDYEGYVSWVAGLTGPACYRISTLTGPTRIVVDIQAP
ncbi:MAG TPA: hypothetical protein VFC81_05960 [Verrucomicrobiae bacterium]|nr:hypothetical protein [Verrucomicrobiae bacterium]